jgi:hypothetical protein
MVVILPNLIVIQEVLQMKMIHHHQTMNQPLLMSTVDQTPVNAENVLVMIQAITSVIRNAETKSKS